MKPLLITRRERIRHVYDNYLEQYSDPCWAQDKQKASVVAALQRLDKERCTTNDIAEILGTDCYALHCVCSACEREVETVVMVGEEQYYESNTAYLCADCLAEAVAVMAAATKEPTR